MLTQGFHLLNIYVYILAFSVLIYKIINSYTCFKSGKGVFRHKYLRKTDITMTTLRFFYATFLP